MYVFCYKSFYIFKFDLLKDRTIISIASLKTLQLIKSLILMFSAIIKNQNNDFAMTVRNHVK